MRKITRILAIIVPLLMVLSSSFVALNQSPSDLKYGVEELPATINAPVTTQSILLASDIHVGTSAYNYTYDRFIDDVNDNITPDALFLLGDLTNLGAKYQRLGFVNQTNNITDEDLRTNKTFALIGNHDMASTTYYAMWENWRIALGYMPNWTYQIGNVLFIAIPTTGIDVYGQISDYELDWLNATIKANTNKNIVLLTHQPISNTTYKSDIEDRSYLIADDVKLRGLAYYHKDNISAWFHGHNHCDDGFPNISVTWNGIFIADISAVECQGTPYHSNSWLLNITDGSKTASLNPRHTGVGVASYFNITNACSFNFKYPVDLNGISLKSTSVDWADSGNVTMTNTRQVGETLWSDLNPSNDSDTWLLYKFDEFGLNGDNRSIKDWSGRGCNLNYSAYFWNWTNGSGISPANDGGGLALTGYGSSGTILKTGEMPMIANVTKNFTLEMTFRYTSAIAGGTRPLIDKTGEFIWGWDTTAYRMAMTLYWSDASSNTYYLNFAPNHTINPRLGSIIHFVATVNTYDHYWRAWYNGAYLGNGAIASKTLGNPTVFKPFSLWGTQTQGFMVNGTMLGFKVSTVACPNGVTPTSTIIIKNPAQANKQMVLGNVIYGHTEGAMELGSKITVTYSTDNVTFYDWLNANNNETMYMKITITSDGSSGAQIKGIGLRTQDAGIIAGTTMYAHDNNYTIYGVYSALSNSVLSTSINTTDYCFINATSNSIFNISSTGSTIVTIHYPFYSDFYYDVYIDGVLTYHARTNELGYYEFTHDSWSGHDFVIIIHNNPLEFFSGLPGFLLILTLFTALIILVLSLWDKLGDSFNSSFRSEGKKEKK